MKNVTTLRDKERLANAMLDDLPDFEDEDDATTSITAAQMPELKLRDASLTIRDFDEHLVYLFPLNYASHEAEMVCRTRLTDSYGLDISITRALQLDLFQKAFIEYGDVIPMNHICELCFREEDQISTVAFAYVKLQLSRNAFLSSWVWSHSSIVRVLSLFGCSNIISSCVESEVWSVDGEVHPKGGSGAAVVDVYVDSEGHRLMHIFLQIVELAYSRQRHILVTTLEGKKDAARVLVVLMRLGCDASVQEHCAQGVWSATQAVLAYCRRLETAELPAAASISTDNTVRLGDTGIAVSAVSALEATATVEMTAPSLPTAASDVPPPPRDTYSDCSFRSPSQRSDLQSQDFSPHASHWNSSQPLRQNTQPLSPPHLQRSTSQCDQDLQSADPDKDQEESQLSSQLHYASIRGSPVLEAYQDAHEGVPGVNNDDCVANEIAMVDVGENIFLEMAMEDESPAPQTRSDMFGYSAQDVRDLSPDSMSAVLLRELTHMVCSRDVTLLSLVNAAQVLEEPSHQGLWEFFVRAVLQHRVAPFFPEVLLSSASARADSSSCGGADGAEGICVSMTLTIQTLTKQQRTFKHHNTTPCMWTDIRAVRAYFKLVAQFVLLRGETTEAEVLEDLEEACKQFSSETTCMEMEDIIDSIKALCVMYLD